MRTFTVQKGCMGYVVTVGCQVCGFTNKEELKVAICDYIDDPKGMEKKYYSKPICEPQIHEGNQLIGSATQNTSAIEPARPY